MNRQKMIRPCMSGSCIMVSSSGDRNEIRQDQEKSGGKTGEAGPSGTGDGKRWDSDSIFGGDEAGER